MGNNDYERFFKSCLKDKFTIKKYLPFKELIIKIFKYQYKSQQLNYIIKTDAKILIIEYVQYLLAAFRRILDEKKTDYLEEIVDYMLLINVPYSIFPGVLNAIIFKNIRRDKTLFRGYNHCIFKACEGAMNNPDKVLNDNSNLRIAEIMRTFVKYFNKPVPNNCKSIKEVREVERYYGLVGSIVAEFYLTDLDVSYLDNFLYDFINNYDYVMSYLELNGCIEERGSYYNIVQAEDLYKNYSGQKGLIK